MLVVVAVYTNRGRYNHIVVPLASDSMTDIREFLENTSFELEMEGFDDSGDE